MFKSFGKDVFKKRMMSFSTIYRVTVSQPRKLFVFDDRNFSEMIMRNEKVCAIDAYQYFLPKSFVVFANFYQSPSMLKFIKKRKKFTLYE